MKFRGVKLADMCVQLPSRSYSNEREPDAQLPVLVQNELEGILLQGQNEEIKTILTNKAFVNLFNRANTRSTQFLANL